MLLQIAIGKGKKTRREKKSETRNLTRLQCRLHLWSIMITIAVGPRFCNAYRCLPYKPSVFGRTWVARPCGYVLCAICGPNSFRCPLLLGLESRFPRPHRVLCHRLLACIQLIINYTPCCCYCCWPCCCCCRNCT